MLIAYTDRPITSDPSAPFDYVNGELIDHGNGYAVLNDAAGVRQSMQVDGQFDPRDGDVRGPYEVCYVDGDKLVYTPDSDHTYVVHFVRRAA